MLRSLIAPIALLAAACSPPASQEPATPDAGMNTDAVEPAVAGPIVGTGTVTQVDAAAGTVTINRGAIEAQFTSENPAILQGIAVGDSVSFELKSATETSVVTGVQKQ